MMESPWKPFLRENILNPYPMYRELRENDPIHQSRTGEWVITRYDDAKQILKDTEFRVGNRADWLEKASTQQLDKWESFAAIVEAMKSFVVFKNPPDHTILRKFILQAWNNREVDQIINENIDILLARMDPSSVELVAEVATPLPAMTMARILGLPADDYKYLETLSHQMIQSLDIYLTFRQIEKMQKAANEFVAYFEKQAAQKLKKPDDGLLSKLLQLNKKTKQIPHAELIANCYFLFIAGEETTAGSIELAIFHLITHNMLNKKLAAIGMTSAIEELLRYDSPTQIVVRMASGDMIMDGRAIRSGDPITICLGAANRDPLRFKSPNQLMLDRTPNHHLAFATGIHRCLGDWLARRELDLLLTKIVTRFDHFQLQGEPTWKENLNMRSFHSLRLSCQ